MMLSNCGLPVYQTVHLERLNHFLSMLTKDFQKSQNRYELKAIIVLFFTTLRDCEYVFQDWETLQKIT